MIIDDYFSAGGYMKLGMLGTVSGTVSDCDVEFDDWKKGKKTYIFENCSDLIAIGAKLESLAGTTFSATAKGFYGDSCTKNSCSGYKYEKVEWTSTAEFAITLGGIFQTSVSKEFTVKLADGGQGGDC